MSFVVFDSKYYTLGKDISAVVSKILRFLDKPEEIDALLETTGGRIVCSTWGVAPFESIVSQVLEAIKVNDCTKLNLPGVLQCKLCLELLKSELSMDEDGSALSDHELHVAATGFGDIVVRLNNALEENPEWVGETALKQLARMDSYNIESPSTSPVNVPTTSSPDTSSGLTDPLSLRGEDDIQINFEEIVISLLIGIARPVSTYQANHQPLDTQDATSSGTTGADESIAQVATAPTPPLLTEPQVEDSARRPLYREHVYDSAAVEHGKCGKYYRSPKPERTTAATMKGKKRVPVTSGTSVGSQMKKRRVTPSTDPVSRPVLGAHSTEVTPAAPPSFGSQDPVALARFNIETVRAPTYPHAHQNFSPSADVPFCGFAPNDTDLSLLGSYEDASLTATQHTSVVSTASLSAPFEPALPQIVRFASSLVSSLDDTGLIPVSSAAATHIPINGSISQSTGFSLDFPTTGNEFVCQAEVGPSRLLPEPPQSTRSELAWPDLQIWNEFINTVTRKRRSSSEDVL